jgi:hypothetical protein
MLDPEALGSAASGSEDRWMTRGVAGIGGASLLADLGHEVPTALPPSFLTSTLGVALVLPAVGSARQVDVCTTAHLHGAVFTTSGAAGTIAVAVTLKNIGGSACTLHGYASLRLANASGPLPTTVIHGVLQPFKTTPKTVFLQPGRKATVLLAYNHVPSGSAPCPTTPTILLRPPGAAGWLTIPMMADACRHRLYESPVLSGVRQP